MFFALKDYRRETGAMQLARQARAAGLHNIPGKEWHPL